jgi:hypothetical protein
MITVKTNEEKINLSLRATLDEGPRSKIPWTNLKQVGVN